MKRPFRPLRSSVLVIVLVTLVFTVTALTAFLEKASNDLLVESRDVTNRQLRQEAYSAIEVTLAVLEDFRQANGGLHSQAEGWGNPLDWAGYSPSSGRTVEVSFQDESGKIPLAHVDLPTLQNLFVSWQMVPADAEKLADVLLGWMQAGYVYSTGVNPTYEQASPAFDAPGRPLRSYDELASIDYAKDIFFDKKGLPTPEYQRFVDDVSLFNFPKPNANSANADVLAAEGQFTAVQAQKVDDFRTGAGQYATQGPQFFQNSANVGSIAGPGGNTTGFTTTISALRILVTVREGKSQYHLSTVIAPQGGATLNMTLATNATAQATAATPANPAATPAPAAPAAQAAPAGTNPASVTTNTDIKYPFTILELREEDEIPLPSS